MVELQPGEIRRENPFITNVKKFIGREVVVRVFTPTDVLEFKGVCEAVEFQYKTVIIRNATETIMIPHYMTISRVRSHPEEASDVKVRKNGPKKD